MSRARLAALAITVAVTASALLVPQPEPAPPGVSGQVPLDVFAHLPAATSPVAALPSTALAPVDVVARDTWDTGGTCTPSGDELTVPRRVQLHHTHIPVVHSPDEVPDALQAICRAHHDRGMDDIGYHYLVDPWGRVWQGRGDLPGRLPAAVREGAHAQGFNRGSVGIALIGDFDVATPSDAAVAATVDLIAHLAGRYRWGLDEQVQATSTGGPLTRYADGTHVTLPAVSGHRDTAADTSCPGEHLYTLLDDIAARATARQTAAHGPALGSGR